MADIKVEVPVTISSPPENPSSHLHHPTSVVTLGEQSVQVSWTAKESQDSDDVMQTSSDETLLLLGKEEHLSLMWKNDQQSSKLESVEKTSTVLEHVIGKTPDVPCKDSPVDNALGNGTWSSSSQNINKVTSSQPILTNLKEKIAKTESYSPVIVNLKKKSNLKRTSSNVSNSQMDRPSRKRIRIAVPERRYSVANDDDYNPSSDELEDELLSFPGTDDNAVVSEEDCCGEKLIWLTSPSSYIDQSIVNVEFVRANLTPVKRTFSVEIGMRFTLSEIVNSSMACKNSIGSLGPSNFHLWVSKNSLCNHAKFVDLPFRKNFIMLANLDAVLKYDLTSPPKELVHDSNEHDGVYFVGDLYQDSTGFRDYLLWRTSQSNQCFTTKILSVKSQGPCSEFKNVCNKAGCLFSSEAISSVKEDQKNFAHLPVEFVEVFRGTGSTAQAQSILNFKFIDEYTEFVNSRTGGKGLHLFVADNAEVSYAYETCREVRFRKHFYSQCLLALCCLREGGTFICKMFDTITLFTNGLLFLMYKCFKTLTIIKPSSSSTYTAERFLICKGKIDNSDTKYAIDFLSDCLDMVVNYQEQRKIIRRKVQRRLTVVKMQVQSLVPLKTILSHAEFFQYIRMQNIRLSTQIMESIEKLCILMEKEDKAELVSLGKSIQLAAADKLAQWNLCAETIFLEPTLEDPVKECEKFLSQRDIAQEISALKEVKLDTIGALLDPESFNSDLNSYVAFPIQGDHGKNVFQSAHGFFLGCGRANILHLDMKSLSWKSLNSTAFHLPSKTLVVGELTEEVLQNKFVPILNLFDAIYVCGNYVGAYSVEQRQKMLKQFTHCIRNETAKFNENLKVVPPMELENLHDFYQTTFEDNFAGYDDPNQRYFNKVCTNENKQSRALVRGFLVTKIIQAESAKDLIKLYQPLVWFWNFPKENQKVESPRLEKESETSEKKQIIETERTE